MSFLKELTICRICLEGGKPMSSIHNYHENISYKDMILSFCEGQAVHEDDALCEECCRETIRCYNFKMKCQHSYYIIQNTYFVEGPSEDSKVDVKTGTISLESREVLGTSDSSNGNDALNLATFEVPCLLGKEEENQKNKAKYKIKEEVEVTFESLGNIKEEISNQGKREIHPEREKAQLTEDGFKAIYECPKCSHLVKSFNLMRKHLSRFHRTTIKTLKEYHGIMEENKSNLLKGDSEAKHSTLERSERMKLFKCMVCDFTHKTINKIRLHMQEHKGLKYISCEHCLQRFADVRRLKEHKCNNAKEKYVQCNECDFKTKSKTQLSLHFSRQHCEDRPHACHLCDFTTKIKSGLTQHIKRTHDKEKRFACPVCNKTFFNSYHMRMHTKIHTGEKQHVCEHCGSRFIQKSNLLKHIEVMHSQERHLRPFPCEHCTYKARTATFLANHMLTHTGRKPIICKLCPFACYATSTMRMHMLKHKGEKNFICLSCPYKCYSKERLKAHQRVHSGERPFECSRCTYRAKTKQRLRSHMKSHENVQKYECENCSYKANYRSNLVHHIKKNCGRVGRRGSTLTYVAQPIQPLTTDKE